MHIVVVVNILASGLNDIAALTPHEKQDSDPRHQLANFAPACPRTPNQVPEEVEPFYSPRRSSHSERRLINGAQLRTGTGMHARSAGGVEGGVI